MKAYLHKIFIDNWFRKLISFCVAVVIWLVVNQSFTISKNYTSINTEIINQRK